MNLSELIVPVKEIALQAGALELEYYQSGANVNHKSDGSPVTIADQEAEELILKGLKSLDIGLPIVAEESVAAGCIPDISEGSFWLVDPLDGTKEFVRGSGDFTVNIALMVNFKPVLGVIYTPVVDELYSGHVDGNAEMMINGITQEISVRPIPDEGLTVLVSRSHNGSEHLAQFLKGQKVANTSFRGSSLKICEIAAGNADLYPRLAPTCEWDIAAGHAIINAAGGQLKKLDGQDMTYGKIDQNFVNPHFIVKAA